MKVILLKDTPKLGRKYDIKDVSDGHALNFLIPRGFVSIANSQTIQKINLQKEKDSTEQKIQAELLVKSLDMLSNTTITISGKANEKGHLFAGISKEMLITEIQKQVRLNLDPETVLLPKPIKEIGLHKVTISALGKSAELGVEVVGEH